MREGSRSEFWIFEFSNSFMGPPCKNGDIVEKFMKEISTKFLNGNRTNVKKSGNPFTLTKGYPRKTKTANHTRTTRQHTTHKHHTHHTTHDSGWFDFWSDDSVFSQKRFWLKNRTWRSHILKPLDDDGFDWRYSLCLRNFLENSFNDGIDRSLSHSVHVHLHSFTTLLTVTVEQIPFVHTWQRLCLFLLRTYQELTIEIPTTVINHGRH